MSAYLHCLHGMILSGIEAARAFTQGAQVFAVFAWHVGIYLFSGIVNCLFVGSIGWLAALLIIGNHVLAKRTRKAMLALSVPASVLIYFLAMGAVCLGWDTVGMWNYNEGLRIFNMLGADLAYGLEIIGLMLGILGFGVLMTCIAE